jgi:hypothetical protein
VAGDLLCLGIEQVGLGLAHASELHTKFLQPPFLHSGNCRRDPSVGNQKAGLNPAPTLPRTLVRTDEENLQPAISIVDTPDFPQVLVEIGVPGRFM